VKSIARSPLFACGLCLAAPVTALSAEPAIGWWAEHVSMHGDLRLRFESVRPDPGEDNDRGRYRGRLGITILASDAIEFEVRLATGDGDPVSTNLDFGESFSFDNVRIDRASAGWSANDSLQLVGGKMKNPLFRAGGTALIWDNDLSPEGLAARFDTGDFFATIGGFVLNDRNEGVESWLYAAQAGTEFAVSDSSALTAGIGWFDFTDVVGNSALYGDDARGNSVDAAGNYLYDYDVLEAFAQYESVVGGWPVSVFAEWTQNTKAAIAGTAYAVGVNVGRADEAGAAEFSWEWRDTEADALVGILTDSDLADGNTDSRGHVLQGLYRVTERVAIAATFIFSEYGRVTEASTEFDRVMFDIEFSF
jgi:hypothetical protein